MLKNYYMKIFYNKMAAKIFLHHNILASVYLILFGAYITDFC